MPDIFVASPTGQPDKKEKKIERTPPATLEEQVVGEEKPVSPPKTDLPQKSSSPLLALMVNPRHVRFQNQEENEEVILLLRKHWITNLPWITVGSLMLLAPFLISFLVSLSNLSFQIPFSILLVGEVFWYLLSFGYLFINFLIWYFNTDIVTNERIVDIDFHSLIYKEVSTTKLEKVQDVTVKMGGVIRQIFNYGDVFVQTAGEEPNFDFRAIPKPAWVAHKVGELMETAGEGGV